VRRNTPGPAPGNEVLRHSQHDRLDGESRLGVTHCEACGRQAVRVDEYGSCGLCHGIQADVGGEISDVSLEILRSGIRAALGRSVHLHDLRAMVEEELRGVETGRPTRRELADRSEALYEAGVP
jgi:hypothetical protein